LLNAKLNVVIPIATGEFAERADVLLLTQLKVGFSNRFAIDQNRRSEKSVRRMTRESRRYGRLQSVLALGRKAGAIHHGGATISWYKSVYKKLLTYRRVFNNFKVEIV
jgi:hypothetical protein